MPVALSSPPTYNGYSTTVRIVDQNGIQLYYSDSFSQSILNSLDLGYPTVRAVTTAVSGAHGNTDTTRWFGDRAITATFTMPERPWTDSAVDALAGLMDPGRRLWLYVRRPNWASERRILVRPATFTCPPGAMRQAQAGWVAPAGLFEDSTLSAVTLTPSSSTPAGGVAFPLTIPMVLGAGVAPGAAVIEVDGNTATPPTIDIYGPCANPIIRCMTTGQQVSFPSFSVAAGDYLHIDMQARTVTLNNNPAMSRYNKRDLASSSWWSLPTGAAVQVVFIASSPGPSSNAVMSWRSRYV
jgi:hypothetical protein